MIYTHFPTNDFPFISNIYKILILNLLKIFILVFLYKYLPRILIKIVIYFIYLLLLINTRLIDYIFVAFIRTHLC